MNLNYMSVNIVKNYGKLIGVSTVDEFSSLLKKVEDRLKDVIVNNKKLPFIPVSKEEALVLSLSAFLNGEISLTLPSVVHSYMGIELKIVVFTYNQYE